jgi:uncharacterized protein YbcV (DUF1398 family)
MFTIADIKAAHAKVKSGADYPKYVQDLIALGVKGYETFVHDGHTVYSGSGNEKAESMPLANQLVVTDASDKDSFLKDIKAHQQGKTDFPTFRSDCAKSGIEKWVVVMSAMTCTYFDKSGNEILQEKIPEA